MPNLLLHDGFDNYTITNTGTGLTSNQYLLFNQVWTYTGTILQLVPGVYGGLAIAGYNGVLTYRPLSTTASVVTLGFRMTTGGQFLTQNNSLARFLSGGSSGTTQVMINGLSSGAIQVTRGGTINSNVLATSSSGIIANNQIYWVEVSVIRSSTVGTLAVKVNGTTIISSTGLNTGSADFDTLGLQFQNNSSSAPTNLMTYDDVYVIDSLTPLGEVRIEPLYPDANDSVTWTPANPLTYLVAGSMTGGGNINNYTISSHIPTAGNWLVFMINREVGTIPTPLAGWNLAAYALDTINDQNSMFIYYRQIDDQFITDNTTTSGSSFSMTFGAFSSGYNGVMVLFEIPYDGLDLFLDAATSATCQFSTTPGTISIPSITSASQDLWVFTYVVNRASSGLGSPSLGGGYDTTSVTNGLASSRGSGYGIKAVASGDSFTPTVTYTGSGTTYYTLANLIIPRKYLVNYMVVNDHRVDGDLSYNFTTSTSATDQFTLKDPSADPATIHFVIPKTVARKDDAASRTITPNIVSGGTPGGSPVTTALTGSYALQVGNAYDKDPNTGAAWTYSAITSLKMKYTSGT